MRTCFVLLISVLLLVPTFPTSTGQGSTTPMVNLECTDEIEWNPIISTSNHTVFCSISNPTAYDQIVELWNHSEYANLTGLPSELFLDAGSALNFTFNLTRWNSNPLELLVTAYHWIYIGAEVTMINGVTNTQQTQGENTAKVTWDSSNNLYIFSDDNSCWLSIGDQSNESMDNLHLESYVKQGELNVDIQCPINYNLLGNWKLPSNSNLEAEFEIQLGGHWTNGEEGCSGSNNGKCSNLNISLINGSDEIFRQEFTNLSDGVNQIELDVVSPSDSFLFNEGNNLAIRFEMKIIGDYNEGGWFNGPSGEEALFRLYLNNNPMINAPLVYVPEIVPFLFIDYQNPTNYHNQIGDQIEIYGVVSDNENQYPLGLAIIHLLIDGIEIAQINSDLYGEFSYNWTIPASLENGTHTLSVFFPTQMLPDHPNQLAIFGPWGEATSSINLTIGFENNHTQGTTIPDFQLVCNNETGQGIVSIYTAVGEDRTGVFYCELYNPSEYFQHISIVVMASGLVAAAPGVVDISSLNSTEFEVALRAGYGQQGTYEVVIAATNTHVNGITNPNSMTKTATLFAALFSNDTDGDGITDDLDAFPDDANETHDSDGDGVGDNSDQFPDDPKEDTDTDGDGVGDNSDHDPENPNVQLPESTKSGSTTTAIYVLAGAIGLLAIALLIGMRRKGGGPVHNVPVYHDNSLWDA